MMGTRHCAWLNEQWRGLGKWYATWQAVNGDISGQEWYGCISSISLLAWQYYFVFMQKIVCNTISQGRVGIVKTWYYKWHHHLDKWGIIEVEPYSANVPHMRVYAADNVSYMSGEGHFCINDHTQVTYSLTRKYWFASNSQGQQIWPCNGLWTSMIWNSPSNN